MEAMAARVWVEREVEKGKTTCQVEEERVGEEKGDVREQEVQREIEIGQSRAWDRCPRGKKGGKQFSREHGKEEDATSFDQLTINEGHVLRIRWTVPIERIGTKANLQKKRVNRTRLATGEDGFEKR